MLGVSESARVMQPSVRLRERAHLAIAPFTCSEERPYVAILSRGHPEGLEIFGDRGCKFGRIHEQDGTLQANKQIREEYWIEGDIGAAEIEHPRY